VVILMISDAAMRSHDVKQEILLAWKYGRPYLPLLLQSTSYPEQVEYWLEGWQWVEVMDRPADKWLPATLAALARKGVRCVSSPGPPLAPSGSPLAIHPRAGLAGLVGLRAVSKLTDQIWPVAAEHAKQVARSPRLRDLGAPQQGLERVFPLGSRVCVAIESDRAGHLVLLDEGTSGRTYCLCPSHFAPETRLPVGRTYLPQRDAIYDSFVITGRAGREHLLAIISEEPLLLDWIPRDPKVPARLLDDQDAETLLAALDRLSPDKWTAMATYFDVVGR
jgi:hypothetical protein